MRILAGRHAVIERITEQEAGRFIPNDLYLNDTTDRIAIITGPNMGGKSTYLRQAALIAILAQMGSFVPAESAVLPIVDRVFTRIGASDNLSRGRSTFMVEMTETAVILNTATARSFIVLDEIGRGTATYDGLALAWAVVEHIHARTRAKTLFATHYHELTELADLLEGVRNLRVTVKEVGREHHLPPQSRAGQGRSQLWHRSGAAGRLADCGGRARARSAETARALRARRERRAGQAGNRGARADPTLRTGGLRYRRADSQRRTWMSFGPSKRCSCWPNCKRNWGRDEHDRSSSRQGIDILARANARASSATAPSRSRLGELRPRACFSEPRA